MKGSCKLFLFWVLKSGMKSLMCVYKVSPKAASASDSTSAVELRGASHSWDEGSGGKIFLHCASQSLGPALILQYDRYGSKQWILHPKLHFFHWL